MKIEVTNCEDCPFCNNDQEDGYSCNFPGSQVEDYEMTSYSQRELPAKCPLKFRGTVIVQLKTENKTKWPMVSK